jgi:CRISPR/Cas system CSM-associated protein Csm4 (group 5 of RAMP superfamily)
MMLSPPQLLPDPFHPSAALTSFLKKNKQTKKNFKYIKQQKYEKQIKNKQAKKTKNEKKNHNRKPLTVTLGHRAALECG